MPDWKQEISKQLAGLNLPPSRESEIAEELSVHLEDLYEEIVAGGATPEEACREVLSSLSHSDLLAELRVTERTALIDAIPEGVVNSGHLLTDLWLDLRYAARMLRKTRFHDGCRAHPRARHWREHSRLHDRQYSPPESSSCSARLAIGCHEYRGYEGCQLLSLFRPAEVAPNFVDAHLNANTGLIFRIAPALRSSRTPIVEALREETRTAGRSTRRITLANTLLAGQVAVSLVLLVTAALFLRSVQREYTFDPGFETKNLAMFMLYPGQQGYDRTKTEQFYKDVRDRLAIVPGVASMSWATNLPLWRRAEY